MTTESGGKPSQSDSSKLFPWYVLGQHRSPCCVLLTPIQLNRTRAAQRTLRDIRKQKPRHTHPSLPRVDLADLWVVTLVFRPLVKFLSLVERLTRVQILGRTLKDYSTTCGSATDNEDVRYLFQADTFQ